MTTDLQAFLDTTAHRRPGRILYTAGFTPDLHPRVVEHIGTEDIAAHYGFLRYRYLSDRRPAELPPLDFSPYWARADLPEGTTLDAHGVAMVPSGTYHFWGYVSPLREATSLKEIENYPMDDPAEWDFAPWADEVADAHANGQPAMTFVGHMYETAWQIRGYEPFLLDTIERPAWAECLLERIFRGNLVRAIAAARAGADLVFCGDDVANQNTLMFSPQTWRTLIHSRWSQVFRAVKDIHPDARIKYHSDGNVLAVVGELVEAGLDILNPLQPEALDVDEVHRRHGDRLTFDGCIGTQSTMPWGTPAEVRARVRDVIDRYGQDGGLIVAPTHVLEPEVPLENIDALVDACREFGTFE